MEALLLLLVKLLKARLEVAMKLLLQFVIKVLPKFPCLAKLMQL